MKIFKPCLYLLSIFCLTACGDSDSESEEEVDKDAVTIHESTTLKKPLRIAKEDFIVDGNNVVLLSAGPSDDKVLNISVYRSNIQAGYVAMTSANNDATVSVEATWDGITFVQSEQKSETFSTYVNFDITSLDGDNVVSIIKFSASLINPETREVLIIEESNLEIGGFNFLTFSGFEMPF